MSVLLSSKSNEWYTPAKYIKAVRAVLGDIELDPASSEKANETVGARRYFTEADDGLHRDWIARSVFLNPPYGKSDGRSNQDIWTSKLREQFENGSILEAIALVNFVPGYKWFAPLWNYPICAVDHCIRFERADGLASGTAKASSAFVYFGRCNEKFIQEFSKFGPIIVAPYRRYIAA